MYILIIISLHLQEEKKNYELFTEELKNYATGMQISFPEFGNSLNEIVSKIH